MQARITHPSAMNWIGDRDSFRTKELISCSVEKTTVQKKLTIVPLTTAKVHIDTATMAATFQFVDLIIVSSEGRLTDGPAIRSATAAPTGAPDPSSIRASGISKKVGNANGTATAATTAMARSLAAVESNVRTGLN